MFGEFAAADDAVGLGEQHISVGRGQHLGEHGCVDALSVDEIGFGGPALPTPLASICRLNELSDGRDVLDGGEPVGGG